ncbi:hypothetical protein [Mycobacterium sp. DBP42]|uniref:hypothetical protein n=1 Tax=Mycobacteriaceae TaxID=1762 RepID=UPI00110D2127|nr:hypothetical protein [Mycobacterium sp. DBP42]TMS50706.1 hypothetical protein E0T84_22745 [Mycobacterium sp. DBP42]
MELPAHTPNTAGHFWLPAWDAHIIAPMLHQFTAHGATTRIIDTDYPPHRRNPGHTAIAATIGLGVARNAAQTETLLNDITTRPERTPALLVVGARTDLTTTAIDALTTIARNGRTLGIRLALDPAVLTLALANTPHPYIAGFQLLLHAIHPLVTPA